MLSGKVRLAKPDPAIFNHAARALAVPNDAIWHVGDSLPTDVAGAKAAGIGAVWLNRAGPVRGPDAPTPDLEVASLDALAQQLAMQQTL